MPNLRAFLYLLVAIGLIACTGIRRPDAGLDGYSAQSCDLWQVPVAAAAEALVDVQAAKPADSEPQRRTDGGDGPCDSTEQARRRTGLACGETIRLRDERVLLALPHLRVNGSANAHGARA